MGGGSKPVLKRVAHPGASVISAHHTDPLFQESLPDYHLFCDGLVPLLFTENETNNERCFGGVNASPYVKDGIHNCVIHGRGDTVNPEGAGTKASAHYFLTVGPGETKTVRLRLKRVEGELPANPFEASIRSSRPGWKGGRFLQSITPPSVPPTDRAMVMRQALAGMLWSKQYFYYDVGMWLREHNIGPGSKSSDCSRIRNAEWFHMVNDHILSMPDKWEYLGMRHGISRSMCWPSDRGPDFAKTKWTSCCVMTTFTRMADPCVRMEFRRRKSTGARLCHHANLYAGQGEKRQRRR
jgi:hypothetical protein